jgi:adenosylcobinamide-GDP ribazoletransferase
VTFLTVLPLGMRAEPDEADLGRSAVFFVPVGLGIGLLVALAAALLGRVFPPLLAGTLAVAVWEGASGCLHLDGWADCCDALPGARSAARRLEILRDPRLGSFGGAGLTLVLLAKAAALASLLEGGRVGPALLLAPALGRAAMVGQAWAFPLARSEGLAFLFKRALGFEAVAATAASALLLSAGSGARGLLALGAGALLAGLFGRLAVRRLGGLTGDVYGATCEMVELAVVLIATARLG